MCNIISGELKAKVKKNTYKNSKILSTNMKILFSSSTVG